MKRRSDMYEKLTNNPEFIKMLGTVNDKEVAEKFGCSLAFVFIMRKEHNIMPSRKHTLNARLAVPDEEIYSKYLELGTMQKVADYYGVTKQAISLRLKDKIKER